MHFRFRDDKYGIVFMQVMKLVFSLAHTRVIYISLQQGNLRITVQTQMTLHFVTNFWAENCCCMRFEKIEGYVKISSEGR